VPEMNGSGEGTERVALLLRVSSEEQRERETIQIQREFLEQYRRLYGLEVMDTYADDGVSGTIPLHERPEGRRLLEDAKAGKFDTVLVYKLDRLGRSLLVIVDAHDRLQEAGVALRSATEPIDTSTPSGRLIFQMLASFAEYDRENIAERTRAGLHRSLRNGRHGGTIPYGYNLAADGSFVIVEDEAAVVRKIIANVAEGSTVYGEAKRLNDEGVPSPGLRYKGRDRRPGASWPHATVARIVGQRTYSGVHEVTLGDGEVIERPVPAIVSPTLQQRAVAALAENKRYAGGKARRRDYLLRGLVYCSGCGAVYVGTGGTSAKVNKNYSYYSCSKRRRGYDGRAKALSCPHVAAEWLEGTVWADVRGFLENPGEVLERVRERLATDDAIGELQARRADLEKRLAARSAEKDRYVRLYTKGHLSEEDLDSYLRDLANQTDNLRLLLKSVEGDIATREHDRLAAADAAAWLLALRERVAEVEANTAEARRKRRELIKMLVERVTVSRGEDGSTLVLITYRFGPPEPDGVPYGVLDSEAPEDAEPYDGVSSPPVAPVGPVQRERVGDEAQHYDPGDVGLCLALDVLDLRDRRFVELRKHKPRRSF
jgi:site-specific DNA recombinase